MRVSTLDQNEQRQLDGRTLDRVFTDKASGRPQLADLLRVARDGDTVEHSTDRLARHDSGRKSSERVTRKRLKEAAGLTGRITDGVNGLGCS